MHIIENEIRMLSIIMVPYNIKARLEQCLENLEAIDMGVAYVIIVVDDAASMSAQIVEALHSGLKLIKDSENSVSKIF